MLSKDQSLQLVGPPGTTEPRIALNLLPFQLNTRAEDRLSRLRGKYHQMKELAITQDQLLRKAWRLVHQLRRDQDNLRWHYDRLLDRHEADRALIRELLSRKGDL